MSEPPPSLPAPARPPLTFSATFTATSPTRPLKRSRVLSTPTLHFFVQAEDTFNPLPYAPNAGSSRNQAAERVRPAAQHPPSNVGLDPLPTDPDTVFLRYPFTTFPNQDAHPDGITYTTLVENPNWFLHPDDYINETSTNPDAVSYPLCLEPPRGWCPAKKKDVKERGAEVWPDGEQPRLRCTFCRRTYAGVNAKSMWRRHVFEKHKIAMSNRRNDLDRPRGRGSNKENKRGPKVLKKEGEHDTIVDLADVPVPDAPVIPQGEFLPALDIALPSSPPPSVPVLPPPSPYDPLLTPSFRHSPPRLPSDQPWRYNSPSHPLHRARNVSLTMLRDDSPIVQTPFVKKNVEGLPSSSPFALQTPQTIGKILPFPKSLFTRRQLASTPPPFLARHSRASSDVSDAWDVEPSLGLDPFVTTWEEEDVSKSPPTSSPGRFVKSPTPLRGTGLGLLEAFALPDSCQPNTMLGIDDLLQLEEDEEEAEVCISLMCSQTSEDPPLKRRRTNAET
ncbi:hypothetical protein MKEN_00829600 [Mycena kentingensis (nom. inval.)]|nr:hypothetical protein MKEN_00829600 [Mycena kentingensis (nom. inval.)]